MSKDGVPTFSVQLATAIPSLRIPMQEALTSNPSILSQRIEEQLKKLIIQPFKNIERPTRPMIIIMDGLDEYDQDAEGVTLRNLVELLIHSLLELPFRVLLMSRPEADIEALFSILPFGSYILRECTVHSGEIE